MKEKQPEAIDAEWHAKIPEDLLTDPKSLGAYIQSEVFLQFGHHFRNLQNVEISRRQSQGFPLER